MSEEQGKLDKYLFTLLRLSIGWTFLFAFLDKAFGWFVFEYNGETYGTTSDAAWINGGDPTWGFLQFGTQGKVFEDFFKDLIGNEYVIWLYMIGLLGIGVSLTLGIFRKIATVSGVLMMIILWVASLPLVHNPFMDDHLVYALILIIIGFTEHHGIIFIPGWKDSGLVGALPILE